MLALKTLLTVAGLLLLTTAFGLPLYALWLRIQNARRIAKGEESVVQPEEISWRGPLGLAMVACLPLLVAGSIVWCRAAWAACGSARLKERCLERCIQECTS